LAAIVVAIVLVCLAGCDRNARDGVSLRDLSPGDCLMTASGVPGTIVQRKVTCAEPHDAEVAATFSAGSSSQPYPGSGALRTMGDARCSSEVVAYVGATRTDTVSAMMFFPTQKMWRHNINQLACVIRPARIKTTTVSLRHP
jgi:hypothetical protein